MRSQGRLMLLYLRCWLRVINFKIIMRDSYVNNIEELLAANESQKNKIQFLQRERVKRDHYLSDLQENLTLNKQTLFKVMGGNEKGLELLNAEEELTNKLKEYYNEYMNINATLLMEQQMKLQDKQFYHERMCEFENKIVDLRKYLHDKEESFTSVVQRLKKYEDISSSESMDDKLHGFKKEIGEKYINEFITDLIKEKNHFKSEYEKIKKEYYLFSEMKNVIINKYPEVQSIIADFEKNNQTKIDNFIGSIYHKEVEKQKKSKKISPNQDLIRLLKKEKLNNELLQQALNDAIEKNEQLVAIKDIFERNVERLQQKCRLLQAENTIFALRLAEYDQHYCRRYSHNKKYYEQGEKAGLSYITQQALREYAFNVMQYYESNKKLNGKFNEKLKEDVDKWGQFICEAHKVKKEQLKQGLMVKSCSTPRMIVGFELDAVEEEEEKMIIVQF